MRLIQAHLALAKAEFAEIGAEIKRFATAGGIAFVAALFVAILIPVGSALFVGEWLFGSIGWGVLVFSALAVAIAVTVVLNVVGRDRSPDRRLDPAGAGGGRLRGHRAGA